MQLFVFFFFCFLFNIVICLSGSCRATVQPCILGSLCHRVELEVSVKKNSATCYLIKCFTVLNREDSIPLLEGWLCVFDIVGSSRLELFLFLYSVKGRELFYKKILGQTTTACTHTVYDRSASLPYLPAA